MVAHDCNLWNWEVEVGGSVKGQTAMKQFNVGFETSLASWDPWKYVVLLSVAECVYLLGFQFKTLYMTQAGLKPNLLSLWVPEL